MLVSSLGTVTGFFGKKNYCRRSPRNWLPTDLALSMLKPFWSFILTLNSEFGSKIGLPVFIAEALFWVKTLRSPWFTIGNIGGEASSIYSNPTFFCRNKFKPFEFLGYVRITSGLVTVGVCVILCIAGYSYSIHCWNVRYMARAIRASMIDEWCPS